MNSVLDKLGSFGAVIAAAACPVCFPKLAVIGLGGLGAYEAQLFIAAQALVVVAIVGHALSYRQHRRQWLLALAILGGAAVFLGLYLIRSESLAYAGMTALVVASTADIWARLRPRAPGTSALDLVITCPECGHQRREVSRPTRACSSTTVRAAGPCLSQSRGTAVSFAALAPSSVRPNRQPPAAHTAMKSPARAGLRAAVLGIGAICMRSAAERYAECLRFGPGGVKTPLHGVDTPL